MIKTSRLVSRARRPALLRHAAKLLLTPVASAASISYDITFSPGLTAEHHGVLGHRPRSALRTAGADFQRPRFYAAKLRRFAAGGSSDITDGQLNFSVTSNGLDSFTLFESGDYTLSGSGTPLPGLSRRQRPRPSRKSIS